MSAQACLFFGFQVLRPPWREQDPQTWLIQHDFEDLDVAYTGKTSCEGDLDEFVCIRKSLQIVWAGDSRVANFGVQEGWRERLAMFRRIIDQGPVVGDWVLTSVV